MSEIIHWPDCLLTPLRCDLAQVPFTRGGGRTLGGLSRQTRTDRGFWRITYSGLGLRRADRRRAWNAIRTKLGGAAGLIVVPVRSYDSAPWPAGQEGVITTVPHDDDTPFDDDTEYVQPTIVVQMNAAAALGATVINLKLIQGEANLAGVRFSRNYALYETGPAISVTGSVWQVPVFPALRTAIPSGAMLEFDAPACLCHLASDGEMAVPSSHGGFDRIDQVSSVSFVEAVDYWNDLAAAA